MKGEKNEDQKIIKSLYNNHEMDTSIFTGNRKEST